MAFRHLWIDERTVVDPTAADLRRQFAAGEFPRKVWLTDDVHATQALIAQQYNDGRYWVEYWDDQRSHIHVDKPLTWTELSDLFEAALRDPSEALIGIPQTRHVHSVLGIRYLLTLFSSIAFVIISFFTIVIPAITVYLASAFSVYVLYGIATSLFAKAASENRRHRLRTKFGNLRTLFLEGVETIAALTVMFFSASIFSSLVALLWKVATSVGLCVTILAVAVSAVAIGKHLHPRYIVPTSSVEQWSSGKANRGTKPKDMIGTAIGILWIVTVVLQLLRKSHGVG